MDREEFDPNVWLSSRQLDQLNSLKPQGSTCGVV